jgi:hypothetical protein
MYIGGRVPAISILVASVLAGLCGILVATFSDWSGRHQIAWPVLIAAVGVMAVGRFGPSESPVAERCAAGARGAVSVRRYSGGHASGGDGRAGGIHARRRHDFLSTGRPRDRLTKIYGRMPT